MCMSHSRLLYDLRRLLDQLRQSYMLTHYVLDTIVFSYMSIEIAHHNRSQSRKYQ